MTIQEWLVGEIKRYIDNQPKCNQVNRFLIKDFIINCRRIDCTNSEIEDAVRIIERERGMTFPNGALMESAIKIIRHKENAKASKDKRSPVHTEPGKNRKVN